MIQTTVKVFLILANNYKTKFGDRRVLDTRKKKEEEQEERTNQTKRKCKETNEKQQQQNFTEKTRERERVFMRVVFPFFTNAITHTNKSSVTHEQSTNQRQREVERDGGGGERERKKSERERENL